MPTYTYACDKCAHEMAIFHGMNDSPSVVCEVCGSKKITRLLGTGAGLIFKGSGFYETDYKRNSNKGGAEKSNAEKSGSSDAKGESKSSASDSTSAGKDSSSKKDSSKPSNAA